MIKKFYRILDELSGIRQKSGSFVSLSKQTGDENKFKPGDMVTMVTGGPQMIVDTASKGGAYCQWFDWLRGQKMRDYFSEVALTYAKERDPARNPANGIQ